MSAPRKAALVILAAVALAACQAETAPAERPARPVKVESVIYADDAVSRDFVGWSRPPRSCATDEFVLVDPQAPADERDRETFWSAVDRDVEHHGAPHVVLTVAWHRRSTDEVVSRYDGTRVWAYRGETEGGPATDAYDLDTELPGGLRAFDAHWAPEAVLWSAEHARAADGRRAPRRRVRRTAPPSRLVGAGGHDARGRRRGTRAAARPAASSSCCPRTASRCSPTAPLRSSARSSS